VTTKDLLPRIEQYLVDNQIAPSTFGNAVGNKAIVFRMRQGGFMKPVTRQRVEALLQKPWKDADKGGTDSFTSQRSERNAKANDRRTELLETIEAFCAEHKVLARSFCAAAGDARLVAKLRDGLISPDIAQERADKVLNNPDLLKKPWKWKNGGKPTIMDDWERRNRQEMEMFSSTLLRRMVEKHPAMFGATA
jgi:hypothetical protein